MHWGAMFPINDRIYPECHRIRPVITIETYEYISVVVLRAYHHDQTLQQRKCFMNDKSRCILTSSELLKRRSSRYKRNKLDRLLPSRTPSRKSQQTQFCWIFLNINILFGTVSTQNSTMCCCWNENS